MIYLTNKERVTLTVLGALALAAMGVLIWQQRRGPILVEHGPAPSYAQWDAKLAASRQVNLNTATTEDLERLPNIGPSLAQRIVEYRQAHGPFAQPEDLRHVPGIGPKTLDAIRDYVTTAGATHQE